MSREYMTDFSLRCGSWTSSFYYFCKAVVMYIILPLAIISLMDGIGPRLTEAFESDMDFNAIIKEFTVYLDRYMIYSIPLLFLSIGIGYYPKGNYARIPFKFVAALYLSIMLLLFTNGGQLEVTLDGSALGYDPTVGGLSGLDMTLSVTGIIYILSIIAFVKGFLAFTEFSDNRKDYLENLAEKFNDRDEKKAAKAEAETVDFDEADDPEETEKPRKMSRKERKAAEAAAAAEAAEAEAEKPAAEAPEAEEAAEGTEAKPQ